jgi:hypothetical protein
MKCSILVFSSKISRMVQVVMNRVYIYIGFDRNFGKKAGKSPLTVQVKTTASGNGCTQR